MPMIDPPHLVTNDSTRCLTHCTVSGRRGGVENNSECTFSSPPSRSSNSLIRKARWRLTATALLRRVRPQPLELETARRRRRRRLQRVLVRPPRYARAVAIARQLPLRQLHARPVGCLPRKGALRSRTDDAWCFSSGGGGFPVNWGSIMIVVASPPVPRLCSACFARLRSTCFARLPSAYSKL